TGTTTFDNVNAALRGASGRITATSSITLQNGASLTIEPSATAPNSKINDAAPIYIDGGTMVFVNNGSTPATETLGTLNVRTYNTSLQYTIGATVVHKSVIYQALVHPPGPS